MQNQIAQIAILSSKPTVSELLKTTTMQRNDTKNLKQIFPEKELRDNSTKFHMHVSVTDLNIPTIDLPILLQEICGPTLGRFKSLTDT